MADKYANRQRLILLAYVLIRIFRNQNTIAIPYEKHPNALIHHKYTLWKLFSTTSSTTSTTAAWRLTCWLTTTKATSLSRHTYSMTDNYGSPSKASHMLHLGIAKN